MKKIALLLVLPCLLALALASSASAAWTHKGKGELKSNASLTLKGTLVLSTSAGEVSCATEIGTTLTASSSAGHVESFTVAKPSECDLTGSLKAICGTNGLTKVEKTGTWALTADSSDITLTSIDVHYGLAGCLIPSFRLKGSATLSLDKATAIGSTTFSGTQTLYNALGEESGTGELKGTLAATPAGTYGVKTAASVETRWTDGNENLASDGQLTLSGSFSFEGSGGSVSCPATIKLQLESSTVEEEEPEGEVESFSVAKPAECDLTGGYKTVCGTNAVAKVEMTGTATLTTTASDIKVAGLVLDYEFEKCAITSLKVEGAPTISVTSPESISSASFSAGALEVFNSKGETLNTATAGGSASASPSGTYQLRKPAWWIDDNTDTIGGEGEEEAFDLTGDITSTVGPLATTANLTLEAIVWNGSSMGEGLLFPTANGHGVVPTLPTSICQVTLTFPTAPWDITLTADEDEGEHNATIDIEDADFLNHYSHGCQTAGLPPTASASGDVTVTAEWDTETKDLSLTVEESHMETPTGTPVDIDTNPDPLVSNDNVGVEQN